jgi:hypothetical protein
MGRYENHGESKRKTTEIEGVWTWILDLGNRIGTGLMN